MAYDNRYRNGFGSGQQGNGRARGPAQQDSRPYYPPAQPRPIEAKSIPVDYVDEAERVMNSLKADGNGRIQVTTTKMRGFLTLVTDIYNRENLRTEAELSSESALKLMRLRVRIVYDAGREYDVRRFVEKAQLLEYIKGIGNSRAEMIRFSHYMEALVAYHRFLGGKEK